MMSKTERDLVYDVAQRAREIAEHTMHTLRLLASEKEPEPTEADLRDEFRGWSRGQLIEKILTDEFAGDSDV